MKRLLTLTAAALAIVSMPMAAIAGPDSGARLGLVRYRARIYTCTARSPSAYGYWHSNSLSLSKLRALQECAVRTPRNERCYVTVCI